MAAGNIQIQPEQVTQIASRIQADSETIMSMMTQLTSLIGSVANASWQGQAAMQFDQAWQQWQASYQQLDASLKTMPPALNNLVSNFQQADQSLSVG